MKIGIGWSDSFGPLGSLRLYLNRKKNFSIGITFFSTYYKTKWALASYCSRQTCVCWTLREHNPLCTFFRPSPARKDAFRGNVTLSGCRMVTEIHLHPTCTTTGYAADHEKGSPAGMSHRLDSSKQSVEIN